MSSVSAQVRHDALSQSRNYSDRHIEKYRSFRSDVNLVLFSTALPQIAALPETKEVTIGSDAVLPCIASGYPVPQIKWSKVTKITKKNIFSALFKYYSL